MWPFTSSTVTPVTSSNPTTTTPPPHPASSTSSAEDKCPVDHSTRAAWLAANPGQDSPFHPSPSSSSTSTQPQAGPSTPRLSTDRVISSIPRAHTPSDETAPKPSTSSSSSSHASDSSDPATSQNWVYPSELQFFNAMMRKNHNPNAEDMATIVPIHNAVNERAWQELMKWEQGMGGDKCGGIKLVSFKGRPRDRTPKAWLNMALGYTAPFDRHDWVIDRCGTKIRYVIDFYTGRQSASPFGSSSSEGSNGLPPKNSAGNLSFYLDVRPALDGWDGVRMRIGKVFGV